MKILGHRHTGILVRDFDRMLAFYTGLGLTVRRRDMESGPFLDGLLGTEDITLETAKLILDDDTAPYKNMFQLELMCLKNADQAQEALSETLVQFDFTTRPLGVLDIAFTVDDINAVIEFIVDSGGDVIGEPLEASGGFPAIHCYARDPEGNPLHLAQNLSI